MAAHYRLECIGIRCVVALIDDDGSRLLTSHAHTTKGAAEYAIVNMRFASPESDSYRRKSVDRDHCYFTLIDSKSQPIAHSELYPTLSARERAIQATMRHGPSAPLRDQQEQQVE